MIDISKEILISEKELTKTNYERLNEVVKAIWQILMTIYIW